MRTPAGICLLLAFSNGCDEKPHPVPTASPTPATQAAAATDRNEEEAEWLDLLAVASRLDKAGISEFKSQSSLVLALRDRLVRDLDGDVFTVSFAPPEPVYQPAVDLQSIPTRKGSLAPGVIEATVDAAGAVVDLKWSRKTDFPEVNRIAEETVKRWRYRPAVKEGRFASAQLVVTIRF